MADIVNLRRARKAAARDADRRKADGNAALHGRGKAEKAQTAAEAAMQARHLDGHRRQGDDEGAPRD